MAVGVGNLHLLRFRCQAEKRKTINGEDILFAMSTLGFDNYVEPLKLYLQKYREGMKGENKVGTVQWDLKWQSCLSNQLPLHWMGFYCFEGYPKFHT